MISLGSNLANLRRYLRDPDGTIWPDATLLMYWQKALVEVAQKTGVLVVAESRPWPPVFEWSITHRWEEQFLEENAVWRPFWFAENLGITVTRQWEAAWNESSATGDTSGVMVTQPWESAYATTEQVLPCKVGNHHFRTRFAAYDEEPIRQITQTSLGRHDSFYHKRRGTPTHFYWHDETRMEMALYPTPTPVITDIAIGDIFGHSSSYQEGVSTAYGITLFRDDLTETATVGIVAQSVDTANALLLVYELYPIVDSIYDETDAPEWLRHTLECAVLSYAFGADTDGFIPSLRDYWKQRKEIGIASAKRIKSAAMRDRVIVRGGGVQRRARVEPRLPSEYPDPMGS